MVFTVDWRKCFRINHLINHSVGPPPPLRALPRTPPPHPVFATGRADAVLMPLYPPPGNEEEDERRGSGKDAALDGGVVIKAKGAEP